MAFGAGPLGAGAVSGPTAPTHRPTWVLVLSSITLLYGGVLLVTGLGDLRNPAAAVKPPAAQPLAPQQEEMRRELIDVNAAIVARHVGAIRGHAAAAVLLALIMLYSAAAAMSRDRHGRTATLTAAWLAIAYQLGSLPVMIPIANDYAATATPLLARMATANLPVPAVADAGALVADAGALVADAGAVLARAETGKSSAEVADAGAAASSTPAPAGELPARPEDVAPLIHGLVLGVEIARAVLCILVSLSADLLLRRT